MPNIAEEMMKVKNGSSPVQSATAIGYDTKDIEAIPKTSILGVGCGAPINYADIRKVKL